MTSLSSNRINILLSHLTYSSLLNNNNTSLNYISLDSLELIDNKNNNESSQISKLELDNKFTESSSIISNISNSDIIHNENIKLDYNNYINNNVLFWLDKSKLIKWFKRPTISISTDDNNNISYYKNGIMNISYLCLDYQIENNKGNNIAIIHECPNLNIKIKYTYLQLYNEVVKLSTVLKYKFDIQKGDVVAIYMPSCPEAIIAMLAVARIGAIHSVIYSYLSSSMLLSRVRDLNPRLILTTIGTVDTTLIDCKNVVDMMLNQLDDPEINVLVLDRPELRKLYPKHVWTMKNGRDYSWNKLVSEETREVGVERLNATDTLYILYTSGSTAKPKGIVRDHGSAVNLFYTMNVMNILPESPFLALSDIGWVMGHSYMVYGPLMNCNTSYIFYYF